MNTTTMLRRVVAAWAFAALGIFAIPAGAQPVRYLDLVFEWDDIQETENVPYGAATNSSGEWQTLLLDVHEPVGDTEDRRPAVVWVHGGFFKRGSKDGYLTERQELARAGYVVFSINYRLRPELPEGLTPELFLDQRLDEYIDAVTDAQHDAQAAVRWVRAHADEWRVDPDRVAIAGHSAGGLIATAVAFNSDDPGNSGSPGPSSRVTAAISSAGGGLPVRQVRIDPGDSPILFSHGLADRTVPFAPAVPPPCAATVATTNVCELQLDPDQGHGSFGHAGWREFLYRWLVDRPGLREPLKVTIVP